MEYLSQIGFWAFLALIPFILIYLIKPKPRDEKVPSLMFFMKESGLIQKRSFLRRLLYNLLFFLQLFAICGLAYSLAQPVTEITIDTVSRNTVIVLDISASMQTKEGLQTRFEKALNFAKDSMKGTSSLILVQSKPLLVLQDRSSTKAVSTLSGLDAKDTATNLGDGILLAKDILNGRDGRIVVISDFLSTDGPDVDVARRLAENSGAVVEFIDVSSGGSNLGFVNMDLTKFKTKAYIKNYASEQREVNFELFEEGKSKQKYARTILPNSIETLEFDTPRGQSKLEIVDNDDLKVDDILYLSGQTDQKIKVLLITNNKNSYLVNALTSSNDIDIRITEPPIFPDFENYDIIIMQNVEKNLVTKVELKKIADLVKHGKSFIISAQDDLSGFDFGDARIIDVQKAVKAQTGISKTITNQITKDVDFGASEKYLASTPLDNNTMVLAKAADDSPMIALRDLGAGKIVYYGIFDEQSNFKHSPSYPIFWNQLSEFLLGAENINNFNVKTGKIISFAEIKSIKTPTGTIDTDRLLLDDVGYYEIEGKTYAANLLDEEESDISPKADIKTTKLKDADLKPYKKKEKVELEVFIVMLAFIILIIELFYMKYTGEI